MRIINGQIFSCETKSFYPGELSFTNIIGDESQDADVFDAAGGYVLPGLIDIHTHGAVAADFSDGDDNALPQLMKYYAQNGVTSVLGTTMTLPEPVLMRACQTMADFRRVPDGARLAGIHLEGPFISAAKKGAQAGENIRLPDIALLRRLNDISGGMVKSVTVAAEVPGAAEFIREACGEMTVSIGHTAANYSTAMAAFEAGATRVTHLYNAMPPLLHRDPGVIAAAMDAGVWAELICDGLHVHPAAIRAAHRLFRGKLALISDSLRCAGMPDGDYTLGGQKIAVQNRKATLADGTLAGSCISVLDALQNAVSFGISLGEAVYAATTAPAAAAGLLNSGTLAPGKPADIAVLGNDLRLRAVFIDGKSIKIP